MRNKSLLLVAAALLTAGVASAQTLVQSTAPNARPADQQGPAQSLRANGPNSQLQQTLRTNAIDNDSYVSQVGYSNYGVVNQSGNTQKADLIQVNNSATLGNDAYQSQSNGAGTTGSNSMYARQIGGQNYADQIQSGNENVAVAYQGMVGAGGTRQNNYLVQEQTGSQNYGYVAQESNNNFAHQKQTSAITTSIGGGLTPGGMDNGNYAVTLQGGGSATGTNGADGQWSQTIQNGQNNRALVSQDH